MNTRQFLKFEHFSRFAPALLIIALAIVAGYVVGIGKPTYVFPLAAALAIPLVGLFQHRWRKLVFLALPLLILVQIPRIRIPLGISPVVLVLLVLAVVELLLAIQQRTGFQFSVSPLAYLPVLVFAAGGLVTAALTGEMQRWYSSGLGLVLLFFVYLPLFKNEQDFANATRIALFAILIFLFLVWAAETFGFSSVVQTSAWAPDWRLLGRGLNISLGPIQYTVWAITYGALAGLGLLLAVFFLVQGGQSHWWNFICVAAILAASAILGLTASRGATLAAAASASLMVVLLRWRAVQVYVFFAGLGLFLLAFQEQILATLPYEAVARFMELQNGLGDVGTFNYRMNVLFLSMDRIWDHPWGSGFNYMWDTYRIDETILYSALLNGTGLLGAVGYLLLQIQFLGGFLLAYFVRRNTHWASLGLGLWVYNLLVGLSTENFLTNPIHTFLMNFLLVGIFWAARFPVHGANKENDK